jgi:prophage maintenance system killer protein
LVDTQYLIEANEKLVTRWNKLHPYETPQALGVRRPEIDDIIPMVEKYDKSNMELDDFIKKASYLMAIISWVQPFLDGNKRTGIVSAIKFLIDNGYNLNIEKKDEPEIRSLLYDIQDQRTSLDHSVVEKIIFYIRKRIMNHDDERITDSIIERYSDLLDDLGSEKKDDL